MLGPSSPASSVAAPAPAPTTTTPMMPMVAVYNIGVSSDNFRKHEKDPKLSWRTLGQELEFLYIKTGLVFIQEAGPVPTKTIAPPLIETLLTVSGSVLSSRNLFTRRAPKILEMHNAIGLCDPGTWTIDSNAIRAVQTWGADG